MQLTPAVLQQVQALPVRQQREFLHLYERLKHQESLDKAASGSFMDYIHHMWPRFIEGQHHKVMASAFDRVLKGECKRLIINLGPRHSKSEFSSLHLPARYLGKYPDRKIMQLSHTADLAQDFGRRVRDLVGSKEYHEVFPETELKPDTKAAGRWNTTQGGVYVAMGIGGKIAGKGADLLIIDDAHSEQEYIRSLGGDTTAFDDAFEWFQTGPRQRLQPNAAIVIVMTRWHKRDLTGRLIDKMTEGKGDKYEVIELPAEFPPDSGKPLWPEFWSAEELMATKATLTAQQWNAQYLQNPTSEEGALIKREHWKIWKGPPPPCDYVIMAWDTAYTAKTSSDYTAFTTWGVFRHEGEDGFPRNHIILLDAFRKRIEFPELKQRAMEEWKTRQPDSFLIEAKASGLPLIQELRRMGIPVTDVTPVRGTKENPNDKVARVNNVTDMFASGMVWRPETRWAEDVAEECAAFPSGDHDDYVDTVTMALKRFREGGFITLQSDDYDDDFKPIKADYY